MRSNDSWYEDPVRGGIATIRQATLLVLDAPAVGHIRCWDCLAGRYCWFQERLERELRGDDS